MDVPGGFPDDESDQSTASAAKRNANATTVIGPVEVIQQDTFPEPPAAEATQRTAAESESDSDSAIYSDAYEDLSEMEGDGFQSLDAVVESPLQQNPPPVPQLEQAPRETPGQTALALEEPPKLHTELSSATTAVESPLAEAPEDEWEKAKAFWRSLTAEKRALLEKETQEEAGIDGDKDEAQPEVKPKRKKTIERRNSERKALAVHMAQQMMAQQEPERATHPNRNYMIKPGERWTGGDELVIPPMRKSMRDEPQQQAPIAPIAGSRLRKSMRANGPGPSSHGSRTTESRAVSKRPESSPVAVTPSKTGHRRSATQVEHIQPPVRRRGSTGSESSFKRSRSARAQGFGFRHSMRPTSPPSAVGENHATKRFSLRTLSPAGSVSPPGTQMRTTLRDSSGGKKPSSGIRMPSFSLSYGGGKKHGSKASAGKAFSSRLADSSDEEGGNGVESGFRSRFEDSSDDDQPSVPIPALLPKPAPSPYAPTGGHLRKESSIASTALPEELEESSEASQDPHGAAAPAENSNNNKTLSSYPTHTTSLRRTRSGKGPLLPASQTGGPSSPLSHTIADNKNSKQKPEARASRRNSILSVLRPRRKKDTKLIGRPDISESAARRDTRLERSVGQLERIRSRGEGEGDEDLGEEEEAEEKAEERLVMVPSPSSQRSSRLQKRGSYGRRASAVGPSEGVVVVGGVPPAAAAASSSVGAGAADLDVFMDAGGFGPAQQHVRRSTVGNLGTRTLSGGSGGGGGGFFHLHPQRRVSSMGMDAVGAGSVDGSVMEGSLAGASSTTRRKRFGVLRKIFGFND